MPIASNQVDAPQVQEVRSTTAHQIDEATQPPTTQDVQEVTLPPTDPRLQQLMRLCAEMGMCVQKKTVVEAEVRRCESLYICNPDAGGR